VTTREDRVGGSPRGDHEIERRRWGHDHTAERFPGLPIELLLNERRGLSFVHV
jgi:hypothetical protein